jgi:hypothetical protein
MAEVLDDNEVDIGLGNEVEPGEEPVAAATENDLSWIQRLREERDQRVAEESLKLGISTWGPAEKPDLVVEFVPVERKVLEDFQVEARKQVKKGLPGAGVDVDIKFICTSARSVYLRSPESGKLIRLEKDGRPISLDRSLCEMLGLDPDGHGKNSHTLLLYLVKGNEIALGSLAVTVARWMSNTSREVEDEVLGE